MTTETTTDLAPVTLTQFLRPNGRRTTVTTMVPAELSRAADEMDLSCEVLMSGQVVIYGRFKDEDEESEHMEFASNSEGPRRPDLATAMVIEAVRRRRQS